MPHPLRIVVLAALTSLMPLAAEAQDGDQCAYVVKVAESNDPHFGNLSLHRFGDRWELQVDTPSQEATINGSFQLDGSVYPDTLVMPGLDDALLSITDEPDSLGLSDGFFDALISAHTAMITGDAGGISHRGEYLLGDIVSASADMLAKCK